MSTTLEPPPLLTVADAAARLRINPATLYRWLDDGRLRSVRLETGPCARLRIEQGELDRFIRESSASAPGTPPGVSPARGSRGLGAGGGRTTRKDGR